MAWNKPSAAPKPQPKKPSALRGIIAGAVVVCALGGLCIWMFSGGDDAPKAKSEKKPTRIAEVTPAPAPEPQKEPTAKPKHEKAAVPKTMPVKAVAGDDEEEPLPKNCVCDLRVKKGAKKPLFSNPVHAQLQEYIYPGRDVPPPDRVSDNDALMACIEGVKINPEDSEEDAAKKEAVKGLLVELKAWLKEGRHADDFFVQLQHRQEVEHEAVSAVKSEIRAAAEEGDVENTKTVIKTYNEFLEKKGLPPVRLKSLRHLENEMQEEESK